MKPMEEAPSLELRWLVVAGLEEPQGFQGLIIRLGKWGKQRALDLPGST